MLSLYSLQCLRRYRLLPIFSVICSFILWTINDWGTEVLAEGNVWKHFLVTHQHKLCFFPPFPNGFGHARIKKVSAMHETSILTEGKPTCGKYLWQGFGTPIHLLKPFARRRDLNGQRWGKTICLLLKLHFLWLFSSWCVLIFCTLRIPASVGALNRNSQMGPLAAVINLKLISYHCRS